VASARAVGLVRTGEEMGRRFRRYPSVLQRAPPHRGGKNVLLRVAKPAPATTTPPEPTDIPPTIDTPTTDVTPAPAPEPAAEEEPAPAPAPDAYYANCAEARAAGAAPMTAGEPGYRPGLDRDNDGIACDN
jgi:hypothetical protein